MSALLMARDLERLMMRHNQTLATPDLVPEIAPEPTGHGLPLSKCEAYNRVYDQHSRSS